MTDDVGLGAPSRFGGVIPTPNLLGFEYFYGFGGGEPEGAAHEAVHLPVGRDVRRRQRQVIAGIVLVSRFKE
jgi:hypothetical protein